MGKMKQNKNGTYDIDAVEVFSAGTWNGDMYKVEDLDKMVEAFEENKSGFRPPLKLGHDENQKLLQQDGYPAAGWVGRLFRKGEKLFADFIDIPKKIAQLIDKGAYKKVSAEIYWNLAIKDKRYPYLLGAVSILGSDNPGVMNLNDMLSLFKTQNDLFQIKSYATIDDDAKFKVYEAVEQTTEEEMPTEEIKDLQKQLKVQQDQMKAFSAKLESKDDEIANLKKENEKLQTSVETTEKEKQAADVKQFCTELKSEKLITPSMEKYVQELLIEPEKKQYSLAEDKKGTKQQAIKEMLAIYKAAAETNFEENTQKGTEEDKNKGKNDLYNEISTEIKEYMAANKLEPHEYAIAHREVLRQRQAAGKPTEVLEDEVEH